MILKGEFPLVKKEVKAQPDRDVLARQVFCCKELSAGPHPQGTTRRELSAQIAILGWCVGCKDTYTGGCTSRREKKRKKSP